MRKNCFLGLKVAVAILLSLVIVGSGKGAEPPDQEQVQEVTENDDTTLMVTKINRSTGISTNVITSNNIGGRTKTMNEHPRPSISRDYVFGSLVLSSDNIPRYASKLPENLDTLKVVSDCGGTIRVSSYVVTLYQVSRRLSAPFPSISDGHTSRIVARN